MGQALYPWVESRFEPVEQIRVQADVRYFGITTNDLITINVEQSTANHDQYIREIQKQLEGLSDNQLISVSKMISAIDNLR
jgi:hypothetical protein